MDAEQKKLRHPMAKARKGLSNSVNCHVRLRLEPVGAVVCMTDAAQLHSMVFSLLSTLMYIHGYGFVHRDIRLDNVLKVTDGWLLIDWELAGRADQMVWWKGTMLLEVVLHKVEPYTCKTDLWQLGMLIKTLLATADLVVTSFADKLLAGNFASAAHAQASMWSLET